MFVLVKILSIYDAKQQPCLIMCESCIGTLTISMYFKGTVPNFVSTLSFALCLLQGIGILFSFPVSVLFKTTCVSVNMVAKSNRLAVE